MPYAVLVPVVLFFACTLPSLRKEVRPIYARLGIIDAEDVIPKA